jgi:predicted MPP superfamily phosphohydrolase
MPLISQVLVGLWFAETCDVYSVNCQAIFLIGVYSLMTTILFISLCGFSGLLAARIWGKHFASWRAGWWVGMSAWAFGCLDALSLLALPRLGLSFGAVGLPLFLALVGRLTVTLVFNPLNRKNPRIGLGVWLGMNLFMSGVIGYSLYIEPFAVGVTEMTYTLPSLRGGSAPTGLAPLRIVHLTDLHVERITRRERDVLAKVVALQPDLLLLTGDYINLDYLDDPLARQDARDFLAELAALPIPYGIYAVNGTVDSPERMAFLFDGLPITVLDDAIAPLQIGDETLYIVGITDHHDEALAAAQLTSLSANLPAHASTILLHHTPDLIETAADVGIDLYLAGHTHGGQIRLPWYGALVTFSAYGKQYEMGQYTVGSTALYISRGLGMEGFGLPRARFLCPPEIVVVNFTPSP